MGNGLQTYRFAGKRMNTDPINPSNLANGEERNKQIERRKILFSH